MTDVKELSLKRGKSVMVEHETDGHGVYSLVVVGELLLFFLHVVTRYPQLLHASRM